MLVRQPETELATAALAIGLAFFVGGTGITIGFIRRRFKQVE